MNRQIAERMDADDPLTGLREEFEVAPERPIYMDGNSLGRPPKAAVDAIRSGVREWSERLVGGWEDWITLPAEVGDRLGSLVGAAPGQVLVCDSTTVNLYKLGAAALAARPGRRRIVGSATDFPTDRYVLEGLAAASGRRLHLVDGPDDDPAALEAELNEVVDDDTALVCLSHVHYRSAARLDGRAITALAHTRGALVLWDLAHSAGSVPVDLDGWEADMAVGCSYKYLNAGPGAPGWLYVRRHLQDEIRQPIWGWFGRAEQFQMGDGYVPAPGVISHLTGTPGVIALRSLDASLRLMQKVGIEALWAKSERMTALLLDLIAGELGPLGARVATPEDPARRGAHVTISHPDARAWCRTLIDRQLVVPDFRTPDRVRLGPAPLYTRYVDCFDAVQLMAETLRRGLDRPGPTGPHQPTERQPTERQPTGRQPTERQPTERLAPELDRARQDLSDLEFEFAALADPDVVALDDEHDSEGSTVGYERARVAGLMERARRRIDDLEAARRRLDEGSYGRCELCGVEIPEERLAALPSTRVCVACASR